MNAERSGRPLAHVAFTELKRRILTCELRPGTMINAVKLAGSLGVSVTPIHDALKQLCAEGLAEAMPKVGYRVSRLALDDVQEIFQLRIIAEGHAVESAIAWASDEELENFAEWIEQGAFHPRGGGVSKGALGSPSYEGAVRHNHFHLRVATLSGNRRLVQFIGGLLDQSQRMLAVQDPVGDRFVPRPGLGPGHRAVADALIARDRNGAIAAMAGHIADGRRHVLDTLFPEPLEYNPPKGVDVRVVRRSESRLAPR